LFKKESLVNHILNINQALRYFRMKSGMSQEMLSELAGLDRSFISLIECGKRTPSLATIEKISGVLKVNTWEILKMIEEHKP